MSVRRFLSRREKSPAHRPALHDKEPPHHHPHHRDSTPPKQPEHFAGVFTDIPPAHSHHGHGDRRTDKEHEKKAKAITERLRHFGLANITDANVEYALHHVAPQDDPEAAFRLLLLLEDTYSGILRPYDIDTKLLGAVNRQGVTCFLDALLFSMFYRLDSFEAMLYENYTNPKQKRLGALLRLWVNLLRSGRLITTDVTAQIQEALADCGWADAGKLMQQDPSEAFTFITGQLELPMLTLKMDMFHTGKEDPHDDHKFVNERLLEVAILDEPVEGRPVITLEDCLEHYFNNRIEVKRHLENQRRNTLKSSQPPPLFDGFGKSEKQSGLHVEVAEVPETPVAASPAIATPVNETTKNPTDRLRPAFGRKRQDSIFSQRKVEIVGVDPEELTKTDSNLSQQELPGRKLSTRTEVLMPAWQFFRLLPFFTDNMPTSDAQVAAHFSRQRPVLGICLKRYSYTLDGQARKRDDYVDIPLEIGVPSFVGNDDLEREGSDSEQVGGNFRLVLQAVVCHRGVSVHSGHYVSLCRSKASRSHSRRGSAESVGPDEDPWVRFDDMSLERVAEIDIHEALKNESPYLLFYQVQPISEDADSMDEHQLPSYTEATSRSQSDATPLEKPYLQDPLNDASLEHAASDPLPQPPRPSTEITDFEPSTEHSSTDASTQDLQRGRTGTLVSGDSRRKSVALDTSSLDTGSIRTHPTSNSVPSTPSEEKGNGGSGLLNVLTGSRRGSKHASETTAAGGRKARSRPTSSEGRNRLSLNMTRLTQRMSKGQSGAASDAVEPPEIVPSETVARELQGQKDAVDAEDAGTRTPASRPPVVAPKGKKERKKLKQAGAGGGKADEERECVVM